MDYLELFAESTEFDDVFIINEVCEEIFESIVEMPSGFEPVPCSSGLCSDKEYNERCESNSEDDCETDARLHDRLHEHASSNQSTQYIETVETLSLTLVTTRYYDGEILVSERRHHNFASSMYFHPEDID